MKLNPTNTGIVKRLLNGRISRPLLSILSRVEAADLASLLTNLNRREGLYLVEALVSINRASDVLEETPEVRLEEILENLPEPLLINILVYAPEDRAAYFLSHFDEEARQYYLNRIEGPKRTRIQQFLDYPEDSAGRMMHTSVFAVEKDTPCGEALAIIREKAQETSIYYIYCVNEESQLVGVVSLRDLVTSPLDLPIESIMKREVVTCRPTSPAREVAKTVAHYDFVGIPVTDQQGHLIGLVTVDEVLDILQEEATEKIYAQAGLQEDDRVFSSALFSIKNRLPWMILNLGLAAVASSVVSLFEDTMSTLIVLASLKNIVAGVGGNTAIQSLTVVTRGLATGDFNFTSKTKAVIKEMTVGIAIGLITGLVASLMVYFWKGDPMVSVVIFFSLLLNSVVASSFGSMIPIILTRFKRDPAAGSGVLATMVTDIFGFFSFLGIASLGLRWFA